MKKNRVVLVDSDADFLAPLEVKFLQSMDEAILDLEVITDVAYLDEYFSKPVSIDILVIDDELLEHVDLDKHSNIPKIFVFSESEDLIGGTDDLRIKRVDRLKNLAAQYNIITADLSVTAANKTTDVVLFYSATGGTGKTTLALSMAARLANEGQKVLYVDAERINSFQFRLENKGTIPNTMLGEFAKADGTIFSRIKHVVRNENFDYLPPFGAALKSYNIAFSVYESIIKSAKVTNEYDVIVVDTDAVYDEDKQKLISLADKVVMVVSPSSSAQYAVTILANSVSFNDAKFYFVCNNFRDDIGVPKQLSMKYQISEFISHIENIGELSIAEISENSQISSLAYAVV